MPEGWDDMVQCELCEEWLHISCEGLKLPRRASGSASSADRQNLDVFAIVKDRIPQQLIIVKNRK